MYYHKGDKLQWKKKTYTITEISGLYSSGGVSVVLESEGETVRMPYIHEFLPKVDSGEIKELFDSSNRGLMGLRKPQAA